MDLEDLWAANFRERSLSLMLSFPEVRWMEEVVRAAATVAVSVVVPLKIPIGIPAFKLISSRDTSIFLSVRDKDRSLPFTITGIALLSKEEEAALSEAAKSTSRLFPDALIL